MPSGSFSKRARNSDSIVNKKNCGGNKKAGLAPRATGPTQFRNVAFNTCPTVNFKIHKGNLPCPENYRNNPGGQCSGGVGALASTRNRGCTYSHSNVRSGGKSSGFSCLDAYVGEWDITSSDSNELSTFTKSIISELSQEIQNELNQFEEATNTTIVGNEIVRPSNDDDIYFVKLNVSGETCNNIYLIGPDGSGFLYVPANPVEFSVTVEDITYTFTKR